MREYIELGPVPYEESCQQVGTTNYDHQMAAFECSVYARQLLRTFPNCHFGVKSFPHDAGNYREVVVYYHADIEEEVDAAFNAENNLPSHWDELAQNEIDLRTAK